MHTRLLGNLAVAPLIAIAIALSSRAESAKSDNSREATALKQSLAEGRELLKDDSGGDNAEAKLATLSPAAKGSGRWHFDLAVNLMRVAFSGMESNKPKVADRAARRAVVHLDKAEALFKGDNKRLSTIYELRGVISERLLDDSQIAEAHYQKAILLNPDNQSANDGARRCDSSRSLHDSTTSTSPATTTTPAN